MGTGACLPAAKAEMEEFQPLPFNTYINGELVIINNSLLYGGHIYVQLRELAKASNRDVDFMSAEQAEAQEETLNSVVTKALAHYVAEAR